MLYRHFKLHICDNKICIIVLLLEKNGNSLSLEINADTCRKATNVGQHIPCTK